MDRPILRALVAACLLAFALPVAAQPVGLERGLNRIGADIADLTSPSPLACRAACVAESRCLAFTHVAEHQHCWLKGEDTQVSRAAGMVSGRVRASAGQTPFAFADTPQAHAASRAAALRLRAGWGLQRERVEDGPEGRLVLREGDIDNLGFGWPADYDPFSGRATDPHPWPFGPDEDDASGTDRIMVGTGVVYPLDLSGPAGDGYHGETERPANTPRPIVFEPGPLPQGFRRVFLQMFVDDFQAPRWQTAFVVTLNGRRLPAVETALNALDQTGPVGKLLTVALPPEFHPLLAEPRLELLIDDPTTGARDGFAFDFVRLVFDPRISLPAALAATVVDRDSGAPIPGARVTALDLSVRTDGVGVATVPGLPGGLIVVAAAARGYEDGTGAAELITGETGEVRIELARRPAPPARSALQAALQRDGRVVLRGIRFDTDSAVPRPDSQPDLDALLALIRETRTARIWVIEGHTDSTGGAAYHRALSEARARAVVDWLAGHGVARDRLRPRGQGLDHPVADNATIAGRALNRRVEAALEP